MIPRTTIKWQAETWQSSLKSAITSLVELCDVLALDPNQVLSGENSTADFPLKVPREFVNRMEKGNPRDPLLLQVLPVAQELDIHPGYSQDPLKEHAANPIPGLLHKYHGRVLLTVAGSCAINCRYCFRRHFPYQDNNPGRQGWHKALDYIREHDDISEVILSGGDPLLASDSLLAELCQAIADIPHVTILRIHSRLPIVTPSRINDKLLNWLTGTRLQPVVVMHCNHPQEIDTEVGHALQALQQANVTSLNQTVLLRDINDNAGVLAQLSHTLFKHGCLPYYLHQLDPVQGSAHFALEPTRIRALYDALLRQLPGYLVPKLVKEIAGVPYKSPLSVDGIYS
ncbi:MAG: EF-P beta-lysylation protein EpmB [Legionellales bacterium]|nr:EF-P beta-lysylation protein EpmB [Legionellales bacterium]|tara:strand:+ start:19964 stop:20989 length:1026 start_codon:yes stop_codon:yes gene_type:complete